MSNVRVKQIMRPKTLPSCLDGAVALVIAASTSIGWLYAVLGGSRGVNRELSNTHAISRWSGSLNQSHFLVTNRRDIELGSPSLLQSLAGFHTQTAWRGTVVAGTIQWPRSSWTAHFSLLPSLIGPEEAQAMKDVLKDAPDEFDEDRDGVDLMITYEFIIMSAGAAKSRDPPREKLRQRLLDITMPIIRSRIEPFVRERYPEAQTVCHSMIRRYLHNERRTHGTHWDIPSFVSVVVSLDSSGHDFDGGFYVTTGTGLQSFIPLQQGDTVVHQGDLLHGVHVKSGNRWSWAMWFQDTPDCSSDPADWWKQKAEDGDPVAQTLRAMRARTHKDAWEWVHSAAASGFPRAMVYQGKAYQEGWNGQSKDLALAAHWYGLARAAGDVDAAFYLGKVEENLGNLSGAASYFKEGAERDEPKAAEEFASYILHGKGDLDPDLDKAGYWFAQAADFSVEAMYQVHLIYSNKTESRAADPVAAKLYLERAARMGHFTAMRKFVEPLIREKRWAEVVPWLLRLEQGPPMEKFVQLYLSGVRMKPFTLFRGEQILQGLADRNIGPARRLLELLKTKSKSELEL